MELEIILAFLVAFSLIITASYFITFCGLEDSSWISNLLFYSSILLFIFQVVIALYFLTKLRALFPEDNDPIKPLGPLSPVRPAGPTVGPVVYHPIPNYFAEKRSQVSFSKEPVMAVSN